MILNLLIFIFFAGFTGVVFSAMMKFQPLNKLPGLELYIFWYRITKPIIGAFGAMILYVIIVSPAFRESIDAIVSTNIVEDLIQQPKSATGFAFGFLTGFTERIILPKLS
jgi:dolichol kinase